MRNKHIMIISAVLIPLLLLTLVFKGTIFQEGNPLPVALGILKLNFSNEKIVCVSNNPPKFIVKYNKTPSEAYPILFEGSGHDAYVDKMKEEGWIYNGQQASNIVFKKDGRTLKVEFRMLTRNYVVLEEKFE